MEHTRAEIRDTVNEIRERVSETLDWRHHVERHPGASLAVAVAVGLLVGRGVGGMIRGEDMGDRLRHGYRPAPVETRGEAALSPSPGRRARDGGAVSAPRRVAGETWSRLGGRVETIVNRLVDEVSDVVEASIVPALSNWVRQRLDFSAGSGGRPDAVARPGERPVRGSRVAAPGGPPPYPLPTPMAEQG
jgi:hypothetical protein